MERARRTTSYSGQYEELRSLLLCCASEPWEVLDLLIIEIVSALMTIFDVEARRRPTFADGYGALRYLGERGRLDLTDDSFLVGKVARHDAVFAYALYENEVAN